MKNFLENNIRNYYNVRNYLNKSYKRLENKFVISSISNDGIMVTDLSYSNVPYKYIAKKLILKYNFDKVIIECGFGGNGWLFTKNTLGLK